MGQETVYCSRCFIRIGGVEFERGGAFRIAGKAVCAACITPEEKSNISSSTVARSKSTTRVRVQKPGLGTSTKLPQVRPPAPRPASKTPLMIAAVAGVVLLGAAAYWFMSSSTPPVTEEVVERKPSPKAPVPPPPEEKKTEDPQLAAVRAAIEAARATSKSDLETQRLAWEEAARLAALTPLRKEASAGLQEIKDKIAAAKPPEPPKTPDKPLAPPPTTDPKPATEVSLAVWKAAMEKGSAGDFEGAAAELRREPPGGAEADLFLQAGTALLQSRGEIARMSANERVNLYHRSDSGERKHVEGTLVRAWTARLEIKQGEETVFVELSDLCAGSVVALVKPSAALLRRYALLCILEGDRDGAERVAGADAFPPRYWEYAKDAASKVPKVPSHELEARRLFYAAEKEYAKTETMSSAIAKYKSLFDNYADTAVVRGEAVRIQKRGEAGKDYFFAMNALKATGTFALAPAARTEFAWVSKSDIEANQALENYVEAEFAALPEQPYKCWALLGGCCLEVFACYLQATEGTELNSKTRQRVPIDPGSPAASPVKNKISGLKKTHEEHKVKGSKTHPKTPARWEWVEIPLPKYATPGPKKIRLLSDQQGFGVAIVVVSTGRTGPPSDADFKDELAQLKTSVPPPPESKGWRALFDGKSKEGLLRGAAPGWKVEDGKLVGVTGVNDAAQTHEDFKNCEIRIRFEGEGLEKLWFKMRQGAEGGYHISLESNLKAMDGKHEVIITALADKVTATLDGKPAAVVAEGAATMGCLQFNGAGKRFAILSLDARP